MKIAVIDDEQGWIEQIKQTIEKIHPFEDLEIDTYVSGNEFLDSQNTYHISFVDIEMPIMDGFDTIRQAREFDKSKYYIILTTNTEMSRKGYQVNAFRYIDKASMEEEMEEAFSAIGSVLECSDKIPLSVIHDQEIDFSLNEIIYFETCRHYTIVQTTKERINVKNRINEIDGMLIGKSFYRCHKSFIINLNHVQKFEERFAYMSNDEKVDIAKRKVCEFRKIYFKLKCVSLNA